MCKKLEPCPWCGKIGASKLDSSPKPGVEEAVKQMDIMRGEVAVTKKFTKAFRELDEALKLMAGNYAKTVRPICALTV